MWLDQQGLIGMGFFCRVRLVSIGPSSEQTYLPKTVCLIEIKLASKI